MQIPVSSQAVSLGLTLAVAVLSGSAAQSKGADTDIYECVIAQLHANDGWLPETIAVVYPTEGQRAAVIDPISEKVSGKTPVAQVDTENDKRVTFIWRMVGSDENGAQVDVNYGLTVIKGTHEATMRASSSRGWTHSVYMARGTCRFSRE